MNDNRIFETTEFENAKEYWMKKLEGLSVETEIIAESLRSARYESCTSNFDLSGKVYEKLLQISKGNDLSMFVILLECFKILFYKTSGISDISIAVPVYKKADCRFNKYVVIRDFIEGGLSVKDLLLSVKQTVSEAYKYQYYPVDRIINEIDHEKTDCITRYLFMMEDIHDLELLNDIKRNGIHNDITVAVKRDIEKLSVSIVYNSIIYTDGTISAIFSSFGNILSQMLDNLNMYIKDIELVNETEKNNILECLSGNVRQNQKDLTLIDLVEEQVIRTPDKTALKFVSFSGDKERSITYKSLSGKSNHIADELNSKGYGTGHIIGIIGDRTIETVISMLAVLKAGGCFLVLNPNLPKDRLEYIIKDSDIQVLLITTQQNTGIDFKGTVIELSDYEYIPEISSETKNEVKPVDLAYIIYTSGSTGNPKGVLIEHQSIVNTITWRRNCYSFDQQDVILQIPSFSFDSSIEDLFTPLSSGSSIILIEEEHKLNIEHLKRVLLNNPVTHFLITPSYYKLFLSQLKDYLTSLRVVTVAGESFSTDLVSEHFKAFVNVRLFNEYGPTENSVCSTFFELKEGCQKVLIGKPIDNVKCLILNHEGKLNPIAIPGELCLAGIGLARGYMNNSSLTEERFVNSSYIDGKRIYRTGDIAVSEDDGNIRFLGRIDHQIKIRGFRIELGEIEAQIRNFQGIKDVVAVVKEDSNQEKILTAFITSDIRIYTNKLKEFLSGFLPYYMVPEQITQIEEIPLTQHGKIDRKALLKINHNDRREVIMPENSLEMKLVDLWAEVLGRDKSELSVADSFFELGGHSLSAVILIERLKKEFNQDIQLLDFIQKSSIRDTATYIMDSKQEDYIKILPAQPKEYYPLSSAQKRFYLLQSIEPDSTAHNMPIVVEMEGEVHRNKLEDTFIKMIERHEVLRTSFKVVGQSPMQKVHDNFNFSMEYYEVSEEGLNEIVTNFVKPFRLDCAPLIRACLIKIKAKKYIFCIDMHHIVSDGVSTEIFINEFSEIYSDKDLEPLKVTYKDYVEWQQSIEYKNRIKNQEEYWHGKFDGEIPAVNLPYDFIRPGKQSFEGASLSFEIDSHATDGLKNLALSENATLFVVLLSIYEVFIYKITNQDDIVVGTATAGRNHTDLQNIIGNFVNILALRNRINSDMSFREFLGLVKKETFEAFQNQDYQFDDLVDMLSVKRDSSRNPIFDIMFILHNMKRGDAENPEFDIRAYNFIHKKAQVDLKLQGTEDNNSLKMEFEYCTMLFKETTIQRFIDIYIYVLSQALQNPELKLKDFEIVPEQEKYKMLSEINQTSISFPPYRAFTEIFNEQAEKYQDKIAIICKNKEITYGELNSKANSLASYLQSRGLKKEETCCILVDRSVEMMIAILAVLKAGGAYVPIDTRYPQDRISRIISQSKAKLLITEDKVSDRFDFSEANLEIINIFDNKYFTGEQIYIDTDIERNNLAYLIFTSGSTGNPKGVYIEHGNLINFVQAMKERIEFSSENRFLALASVSFDLSVSELLLPLAHGASIVIATNEEQQDPSKLISIIIEKNVDLLHLTPSRLKMLLDFEGSSLIWDRVKLLAVGGEALPGNLLISLKQRYKNKVYNMYGPTEATVWATSKDLTCDDVVTIGKPLPNIEVFVVNQFKQLLPVGVPGELAIGGKNTGRGYTDIVETERKFSRNKFNLNADDRIYYTGDMARILENGEIEYLGRGDNQVKLRGYRIELEEIENQLLNHSLINQAVVIPWEGKNDNRYLCAYVVGEKAIKIQELKDFLAKKLPEYMIPSYIVQLDKIPLSQNGKLDRKSLPEPSGDILIQTEYVAPKNETEDRLVNIWHEVLGTERIGVEDNFFEIGGNSMLLIQVHSMINSVYPSKVSVADLFTYPTISKLTELILKKPADKKKIHIKTVKFPEDYFRADDSPVEHSTFVFKIPEALREKLISLADLKNIEVQYILLTAYMYLLHEISEEDEISTNILGDTKGMDGARGLDIDMSEISSIENLLLTVYEKCTGAEASYTYYLDDRDIFELSRDNYSIASFFSYADYKLENISDIYDVILKVNDSDQEIDFICIYNHHRLKQEKVMEMIKTYISVIEALTENIN
ncbi:non-ribosomal peptide synthetase [Clostridium sp. BNL1100]|uniref:non-ribosomal peptide synthetase n=1 Tax=Clostridium sp. BNL1100 TaxID=755731 RepID=UPI00024A7596|nr:non-ribosomal peptide synthetase [Clostridium sp. BNL1100]AEY65149.1 amino acid adenylation enzyme/thioester reductase family protein [Clostridium sp. BNL1100]